MALTTAWCAPGPTWQSGSLATPSDRGKTKDIVHSPLRPVNDRPCPGQTRVHRFDLPLASCWHPKGTNAQNDRPNSKCCWYSILKAIKGATHWKVWLNGIPKGCPTTKQQKHDTSGIPKRVSLWCFQTFCFPALCFSDFSRWPEQSPNLLICVFPFCFTTKKLQTQKVFQVQKSSGSDHSLRRKSRIKKKKKQEKLSAGPAIIQALAWESPMPAEFPGDAPGYPKPEAAGPTKLRGRGQET